MKQLLDEDFHKWLNAIERGEEFPSTLPPDDAADLRLAQRLFELRTVSSQPLFPEVAGFHLRVIRVTGQRRQWLWHLAAAALFVILLLAAAISSSGTARAQILKSLGLADDEPWFSPVPVIFEGHYYEAEEFNLLLKEQLQAVDLVLVPDEDENGHPILYAFLTPEEARSFLIETRGVPSPQPPEDDNNSE